MDWSGFRNLPPTPPEQLFFSVQVIFPFLSLLVYQQKQKHVSYRWTFIDMLLCLISSTKRVIKADEYSQHACALYFSNCLFDFPSSLKLYRGSEAGVQQLVLQRKHHACVICWKMMHSGWGRLEETALIWPPFYRMVTSIMKTAGGKDITIHTCTAHTFIYTHTQAYRCFKMHAFSCTYTPEDIWRADGKYKTHKGWDQTESMRILSESLH